MAATADAAVREVSDAADDVYNDVLRPGWELEVRLARDEATAVTDAAEYGIHAAGTMISDAAQAGSRVYHEVTRVAEAIGPDVGVLAGLLDEARSAVKAAGRSTEDLDWSTALESVVPLVREGRVDEARTVLAEFTGLTGP